MTDFDYINWILNEKNYLSRDQIYMKEESGDRKITPHKVKIVNSRGIKASALFEFGSKRNADLLNFFNSTNNDPRKPNAPKGLLAFCDYILLSEFKDKLIIILIELKRGEDRQHAKRQIEGAKLFMEYVLASAERIKRKNSVPNFNKDNIEFRKVIIERIPKEPIKSHKINLSPKNDYIIYPTVSDFYPRHII